MFKGTGSEPQDVRRTAIGLAVSAARSRWWRIHAVMAASRSCASARARGSSGPVLTSSAAARSASARPVSLSTRASRRCSAADCSAEIRSRSPSAAAARTSGSRAASHSEVARGSVVGDSLAATVGAFFGTGAIRCGLVSSR